MSSIEQPSVSVVVCTRNRPNDVERLLDSLALVDYENWHICVIDQSTNNATEAVIKSRGKSNDILRYERLSTTGLSRARNKAIEICSGDIIAFIDDDCTVAHDWLRRVITVFEQFPHAAACFGEVRAEIHDWHREFVPFCLIECEEAICHPSRFTRFVGIGASMYIRQKGRNTAVCFDEKMGAGSGVFESYEERDFVWRLLEAGYCVVQSPQIEVIHHGTRRFDDGSAQTLMRVTSYSAGAMHAKMIKCGNLHAIVDILPQITNMLLSINLTAPIKGKPSNIGRLIMHINGLIAGICTPIDVNRRLFL